MLHDHAPEFYIKEGKKKPPKFRKKTEDNSEDIYHLHFLQTGDLSTAYYELLGTN